MYVLDSFELITRAYFDRIIQIKKQIQELVICIYQITIIQLKYISYHNHQICSKFVTLICEQRDNWFFFFIQSQ